MKHKLAAVLSTLVLSFCLLVSPTLTQDAVEITAVQWSPDGSMLAAMEVFKFVPPTMRFFLILRQVTNLFS
jgi:hypothetical protein